MYWRGRRIGRPPAMASGDALQTWAPCGCTRHKSTAATKEDLGHSVNGDYGEAEMTSTCGVPKGMAINEHGGLVWQPAQAAWP